jgi:hypothetical protein
VSKDADYLLRARAKADEVADENLYGDAVRAFQAAYQAGRAEAAAAAHEAGRREGVRQSSEDIAQWLEARGYRRLASDLRDLSERAANLPTPPSQAAEPCDPYKAFDRVCGECGQTWRGVHPCPARRPAPPAAPAGCACVIGDERNCRIHTGGRL